MSRREEILTFLKTEKETLQRRFSVRRIGLFGSHVRDAARQDSDLDLLVEFDEPTFDHYMDLKFYVEDRLGITVDLVVADALKPRLRPYIEKEVVYA